jgi:hypothetical protein
MTRRRFIKEILFAASPDDASEMDLIEGPEGLFPSLPDAGLDQGSLALLSTLLDSIDHHTALERLHPLQETPEGSRPHARP